MKMFTKLALVSSMAISANAMAMQSMDDAALSAATGQDGINIGIGISKIEIDKVKENRLLSKDESLQKLAQRPHQFRDLNEAKEHSIIIPIVSSERRKYIPVGFLDKEFIIPNSAQAIYDAEPWIFGIISSYMHNLWVKTVSGKLKTDYRYSSVLCYNTFPFPEISNKQKEGWGKAIIVTLSNELKKEFPKTSGFSTSNLSYMVQFYNEYHIDANLQPLVGEISWTKNLIILSKCKDSQERQFYILSTKKFGWTKDVLINQVENKTYEKYLLNQTNFDAVLPEKIKKQAYLAIKDHYTFDFMELADEHSE